MLEAVQAHEIVHSDDWKNINDRFFAIFRTTVEGISVDYVDGICDDAAKAQNILMTSAGYNAAMFEYKASVKDGWAAVQHPICNARTYAAEETVTGPMQAALDAKAAAQNPVWTR